MSTLNDYIIDTTPTRGRDGGVSELPVDVEVEHWVQVLHRVCGRVVVTSMFPDVQHIIASCDSHTPTCPGPNKAKSDQIYNNQEVAPS